MWCAHVGNFTYSNHIAIYFEWWGLLIAKLCDEMQVKYTYVEARLECGDFEISYVEGRSGFCGHIDRSLHLQTCNPVVGESLLGQIG